MDRHVSQEIGAMLRKKSLAELEKYQRQVVEKKVRQCGGSQSLYGPPRSTTTAGATTTREKAYWLSVGQLVRETIAEKQQQQLKMPLKNQVDFVPAKRRLEKEDGGEQVEESGVAGKRSRQEDESNVHSFTDAEDGKRLIEDLLVSLAPLSPTSPMSDDDIFLQAVPFEQLPSNLTVQWQLPSPLRPPAPRYVAKVFRTFDWSKYNQAHYNTENLPPKYIQGYQFRLFYPALSSSGEGGKSPHTALPAYKVVPCPKQAGDGMEEFVYLVFFLQHSLAAASSCAAQSRRLHDYIYGNSRTHSNSAPSESPDNPPPPYADCVFKIVKRDWETNHKFGFKCFFENGIFHLDFHFKKLRYKR
jgi:hypothetical protein